MMYTLILMQVKYALVGENGAGKSTLMKILTGIYSMDSGSIMINNNKVNIDTVRDAQKLGIVMIPQELNLGESPDSGRKISL